MRVLVVDDSRAMRMIVTRALRAIPAVADVAQAESAEAAIEVLTALPVDLVLCDWNMGGMTGLELLEALRAAGWATPFGFVTSESSAAILDTALAAGAPFLVAKPFCPEDLAATVATVLSGGDPTANAAASASAPRDVGLGQLLGGLLRRDVSVAAAAHGPERQAARWTADYLSSSGETVAKCVVETPLATAMSAAFTMIPPATAREWSASGTLPDLLAESFHEVTNVLAAVVRAAGARCVLGAIAGFAPGERLPDAERILAAVAQEDFQVRIPDYCEGLLSLVTF